MNERFHLNKFAQNSKDWWPAARLRDNGGIRGSERLVASVLAFLRYTLAAKGDAAGLPRPAA